MNERVDATTEAMSLEREIEELRQRLHDAEDLHHAISLGQVDAFVVGPSEDAKRVLLLSGAYARYRQLVEDMAQGALTVNRSGEIMFANQAFAAMLGVAPIDLFRMPLQRFLATAEDGNLAGILSHNTRKADIKATLQRSDGTQCRVRMSLVAANDDFTTLLVTERSHDEDLAGDTLDAIRTGAVDALVVGGEQVVMLDSAQRFYQAAVDRMQQGVLIIGAGGDIVYANQRIAGLLGMQRDKLAGSSLYKHVINRDHPGLKAILDGDHGSSAQAEVRLRKADGELVSTLITVSAIADGQKMCLVSDLSMQKRHQATDERTRKFLGTLAHEFRNILGPIRNAVEYLDRVDLDPECRKMVELVDRQSRRLLALVEDLRTINPKE
jgi:PAS domain S-box-containing protein